MKSPCVAAAVHGHVYGCRIHVRAWLSAAWLRYRISQRWSSIWKENNQVGHHARPRRASATAPLHTGADMCKMAIPGAGSSGVQHVFSGMSTLRAPCQLEAASTGRGGVCKLLGATPRPLGCVCGVNTEPSQPRRLPESSVAAARTHLQCTHSVSGSPHTLTSVCTGRPPGRVRVGAGHAASCQHALTLRVNLM